MTTKDSTEQMICKAVVYAILQDTLLTDEQRQILSLAYFERLAKMPGCNYRFCKNNSERKKARPDDLVYEDRSQRYSLLNFLLFADILFKI